MTLAGLAQIKACPHRTFQFICIAMESLVRSYKINLSAKFYCKALIFAVNNGTYVCMYIYVCMGMYVCMYAELGALLLESNESCTYYIRSYSLHMPIM